MEVIENQYWVVQLVDQTHTGGKVVSAVCRFAMHEGLCQGLHNFNVKKN